MKRISISFALFVLLSIPISAQEIKLEDAAGIWQINTEQSDLTFAIENFGFGTVKGVFKGLKGVIMIDQDLSKSTVRLSIESKTIESGNDKRNEHLKSADFFDIVIHSLVKFEGLGISFTGNKKNYHSPQNSYLNTVLETKKGNPLSLSILYQVLAESLEIPIKGVNLPNHFILAYQHLQEETNKPSETETCSRRGHESSSTPN